MRRAIPPPDFSLMVTSPIALASEATTNTRLWQFRHFTVLLVPDALGLGALRHHGGRHPPELAHGETGKVLSPLEQVVQWAWGLGRFRVHGASVRLMEADGKTAIAVLHALAGARSRRRPVGDPQILLRRRFFTLAITEQAVVIEQGYRNEELATNKLPNLRQVSDWPSWNTSQASDE